MPELWTDANVQGESGVLLNVLGCRGQPGCLVSAQDHDPILAIHLLVIAGLGTLNEGGITHARSCEFELAPEVASAVNPLRPAVGSGCAAKQHVILSWHLENVPHPIPSSTVETLHLNFNTI